MAGLPRSRTGWLANLLTYGQVHCLHDGLHGCSSFGHLRGKLDSLPARTVGNSDSGLGFVWRGLARHFPSYKTVFVWRDKQEAMESFLSYFANRPYLGMEKLGKAWATAIFDELQDELAQWRDSRYGYGYLDVNFDSLESSSTAEMIWKFLTDEPFNHQRWELLHGLRVNPASEKFSVLPEKFAALRNESLVSSGAA